jgi:hypothetical protein
MTKAEAELLELMRASDRARICGLSPRSHWKRVPTRVPGRARDFVKSKAARAAVSNGGATQPP